MSSACLQVFSSFFFLLTMERLYGNCAEYPRIMKNVYASYHDGKKFTVTYGLQNIGIKTNGKVHLLFEDKDFYYVDRVNISCRTGETKNMKDIIYLEGNMWTSHEPYSVRCRDESKDFTCPKSFKCGFTFSYFTIELQNESIHNLNIDFYGYETNYYKFVGCYEERYFEKLEPLFDSTNCESTCTETAFYGFNWYERCVCMKNLPKVSGKELNFCELCHGRRAIFCGKRNYISVYSKNLVQQFPNYDPKSYPECMNKFTWTSHCPSCNGTGGNFCTMISCRKFSNICGNKSCIDMFGSYKGEVIGLCLCGRGFYTTDGLGCHDVDECTSIPNICDQEATTCINLFGDYECSCQEGYIRMELEKNQSRCIVTSSSEDTNLIYFVYGFILFFLATFVVCFPCIRASRKK